jgi:hypothetical protein
MPYGTVKVDNITFTNGGSDQNITVSGLYNSFTSGISVTGTISGAVIIGSTSVSGATVIGGTVTGTTVQGGTVTGNTVQGGTVTGNTVQGGTVTGNTVQGITGVFVSLTGTTTSGTTANFSSGVFTTQVSGNTVIGPTHTGTTANFSSGVFTSQISGAVVIGTTTTGISANFDSGVFTTSISGTTVTGNTGQFTTLTAVTGIFTSGTFSNGLVTSGIIQSTTGGFKFPDGTTQTTAATATANVATTTGIQTFTAAQRGAVVIQAYSTGIALNFSSGNNFQITLTGSTTLQTPTNIASGQAGVVTIIQGSASNTMAFSTGWLYPGGSGSTPTITATSGAVDLLVYYTKDASSVSYRLVQDVKA